MSTSSNDGILLPGLDGTNPLGFLAALGAFRVLSIQNQDIKLAWGLSRGTWRPELFGVQMHLDDLGAEIHAAIQKLDKTVWSIDKELPFEANRLREAADNAVSSAERTTRSAADTLAAFGAECFFDVKTVGKGEQKREIRIFRDTYLRLVRSGDNQHNGLLSYAARTIEQCTAAQLQTSISSDWQYEDEKLSFRWDPAEDRGYALQWGDPSYDGALTERGANCLGLFAMACLPTIPVKGQVETTGFGLKEPKQASLTWPIWKHPVNLNTVGSLIALSELQKPQPSRPELNSRGIAAVYRCNRIMTSTYYANFTPAQRVA